MKSYTDLSQSKKLAEILPLESADMWFANGMVVAKDSIDALDDLEGVFHCWSLAALLEKIPYTIMNIKGEDLRLHIDKDNHQYSLFYENEYTGDMFEIETKLYDDMIDACYEMIIKLNEQNLFVK